MPSNTSPLLKPDTAKSPSRAGDLVSAPLFPLLEEPLLAINEIQGNSLAGFNKDYQTFLFLRIQDVVGAKVWLQTLAPTISTLAEVLTFNRLFRSLRIRQGKEPVGLSATWLNIAFSRPGIAKLTSEEVASELDEPSFQVGLHNQASGLGDPLDTTTWKVGGTEETIAHILLIIASDQIFVHNQAVQQIQEGIASAHSENGSPALELIFEQAGATLPDELRGHEHFGFKDGISQPGIRGRVSNAPDDFITPRWIDPSQEISTRFGKPGQPLVWPGQFVLGYVRQRDDDPIAPKEVQESLPQWADNGSYVVVRRLQQDVEGFREFVKQKAEELAKTADFPNITPMQLAARLVGRWPSGAPILRSPEQDNPALGSDGWANNNFLFQNPTSMVPLVPIPGYTGDTFAPSLGDTQGILCPFAGHIRKVNPRDDSTDQSGPSDSLTRLILRRGIPYGSLQDKDRGLMFVSYQASIQSQFYFLSNNWVNVEDRPVDAAGFDAILGQRPLTSDNPTDRSREVILRNKDANSVPLTLPQDYIHMTGGGYFFSPSLSTLVAWATL